MDTQALRDEHSAIMGLASRLGGVAIDVRIRDDAYQARALVLAIDALLQGHLVKEDTKLYPALTGARDLETRVLGATAHEEMGGIVGAWNRYRDHWTPTAMLSDARRFAAASEGIIGALSLRIEMENDILYPAMDRLTAGRGLAAA